MEEQQLASLIGRLQASTALRARIKGILVVPGGPAQLSPAEAFPLAEHAPYDPGSYAWNPNGTGISALDLGTPVFLLEQDAPAAAQAHAACNAERVRLYPHPLLPVGRARDHAKLNLQQSKGYSTTHQALTNASNCTNWTTAKTGA